MYAAGAAPRERALRDGQRYGHGLLLCGARGRYVLQQLPGGAAGLAHQREEGVDVAALQRVGLLGGPSVVREEVHGPQHGAVARGTPELRQGAQELGLVHLAEHLPAEIGRHGAHLLGDGGILARQRRVAGAGVDYAQRIAQALEVHGHAAHHRLRRVREVYGHRATDGGRGLVHEPAGLAEIDVLRPLAELGDGDGVELARAEQTVLDDAQQHLAGRRG